MGFDLHRHDEASSFDGFGKPTELASLAKEYGYTMLAVTNHGNTTSLIQHYLACKDVGIKPGLGVEGYFLPKYKPQDRGFHLILLAKNAQGYANMNRIQYEGEKQKYYNPIWDFKILEKYHEGLICSTACVAGYLGQCIIKGKIEVAAKYLKRMKSIFGEDFYVEIQPYSISEEGLQEKINVKSIELAKKLGIKCILTSDSHRGRKEDFDTYLKMHEIKKPGNSEWLEHITKTYKERYMPKPGEMMKRFYKMHKSDFGEVEAKRLAKEMERNLDEIEAKVEDDIFKDFKQTLPKFSREDSTKLLVEKLRQSMKQRGKTTKAYINRVKEELEVIKSLGFQDYFLIVADYVNWAKEQGITVGPGRGSACNCEVAYFLGITEVDSLYFGLDFRRFLRKDKKKMPDIDIDFERCRRQEAIEYLINKYPGHTARIASYGLYKVDNLINDLAKVCGLPTDSKVDPEMVKYNKKMIADLKSLINSYIDEGGVLDSEGLLQNKISRCFNSDYDNIVKHFTKLYMKLRFIGTHAAGVAVTGGNILDFTSLRIDKNGDIFTSFDLNDMENIHVIKFDMLGLRTMESTGELRELTGCSGITEEIVNDSKLYENFRTGQTDGIFQFDKEAVRGILKEINCDCFGDVIAANAMNRPGPLKMKQPQLYADNKLEGGTGSADDIYKYTKDSYGTIIYQEQIQQICVGVGGMTWGDADKVMKMIGGQSQSADAKAQFEKDKKELHDKFVQGAVKNGFPKSRAEEIFDMVLVYSFNKGHACGYSLISLEEMYYKTYFPLEYWYTRIKYALTDSDYDRFCGKAVANDVVIFLPHANYSASSTSIRVVDGDRVIQQSLNRIKGVGDKAADFIVEERKRNGIFTSYDNFYDRCKSRVVTTRVISLLDEAGALNFNKKKYLQRVVKYNSSLYAKALR